MSRQLLFTLSPNGELCVVGTAYATTHLPMRRVQLPGGRSGLLAADLLDYHAAGLQDETVTDAARALHKKRYAILRKALEAAASAPAS